MNLQQKNKTCVRVLNESTVARIRAVVLFLLPSIRQKDTLIIPLGCPVLEQPKVHYAQKIGMICERLMKNIKKIVWANFFDKTLLTMIIINNIICSGMIISFKSCEVIYMSQEERFQEVLNQLKKAGYRITEQRKLLLHIILNNEYSSCKEIYYAAKKQDDKVGIATVYRTVQLLEDMELIHKEMVVRI